MQWDITPTSSSAVRVQACIPPQHNDGCISPNKHSFDIMTLFISICRKLRILIYGALYLARVCTYAAGHHAHIFVPSQCMHICSGTSCPPLPARGTSRHVYRPSTMIRPRLSRIKLCSRGLHHVGLRSLWFQLAASVTASSIPLTEISCR